MVGERNPTLSPISDIISVMCTSQVRSTADISSEIIKVDMAPADSTVVKQFYSCMLMTNKFLDLYSLSHLRLQTFTSTLPDDLRSEEETGTWN